MRRCHIQGGLRENMNTHRVTVNSHTVGEGGDHFKLVTMVRSLQHYDGEGNIVTTRELVMAGVNELGGR
jgi:hypothetical protein